MTNLVHYVIREKTNFMFSRVLLSNSYKRQLDLTRLSFLIIFLRMRCLYADKLAVQYDKMKTAPSCYLIFLIDCGVNKIIYCELNYILFQLNYISFNKLAIQSNIIVKTALSHLRLYYLF